METFLMKNWQCFGRFLGRGWRGDGNEQKVKREGFSFFFNSAARTYVHPVSLNHVLFYCCPLGFLSARSWRSRKYLVVCSDCSGYPLTAVSIQILMKHSALENIHKLVFAGFVFTSLKCRRWLKALGYLSLVVAFWLLQKQLHVLSQQKCW